MHGVCKGASFLEICENAKSFGFKSQFQPISRPKVFALRSITTIIITATTTTTTTTKTITITIIVITIIIAIIVYFKL